MKYRFNYRILVVMLSAILMLHIASAQQTSVGFLSVSNVTFNNTYIQTGDHLVLSFELYNSYTRPLYNMNLQLESESPLLNVSPSQNYLVSNIGEGLDTNQGFYFNISIPNNLPSGEYTVYAIAYYKYNVVQDGLTTPETGESEIPISFYVHGKPNVTVSVKPVGAIMPNSYSNLEFLVMNSGTDAVHNLSISLKNSSTIKFFGQKSFYISGLPYGNGTELEAEAYISNTIKQGYNPIDLNVSYSTLNGKTYSRELNTSLYTIFNEPELNVSLISTEPQFITVGSNQTVMFSISNTGLDSAKNIELVFEPVNGISFGSLSRISIPKLYPNESLNEQVYIRLNRNYNKSYISLPIELEYSYPGSGMSQIPQPA